MNGANLKNGAQGERKQKRASEKRSGCTETRLPHGRSLRERIGQPVFIEPESYLPGMKRTRYPALKQACLEMRQMLTQKTAGQRKDRPQDLSWDNLERVKVTIICEAMALVFSGEYEPTEKKDEEREH